MQNNEDGSKAPSAWAWVLPGAIGVILAKTLGLVGGLITIGSYFWLQPKIGTLRSTLLSAVLGIASGIGLVFLMQP